MQIEKEQSSAKVNDTLRMKHHKENLPLVINSTLKKGNLTSVSDLEAIAVTIGPGTPVNINQGLLFA